MASVLDGPREERRRVLVGGVAHWARPEGADLVLADGRRVAEAEAIHLAPCAPTKILCVHLNYESRRVEFRSGPIATPTYFQKPVSALNAHRGLLHRPADCKYLNYEGEIAAIVGRPMRNLLREEVWDHLAGFAPANDVGSHDYRETDAGSMLRVKGMDGFCPIGPGIVRGVDVRAATVRTYVNGVVVQEGAVAEMLFPIDYLLADLARHITLLPGDIVLTGTPAHSRPLKLGDVVEVEVSGLGRLSNTVAEIPAPRASVGHQPTDSDAIRRVALGSDAPRGERSGGER
jgi:5-oxopent-3-ene-1,2,5-tricarboxylate decarboxylase/2-hydroxyhepta-2,4-diene-1,7-dioate isomerase